MAHNLLILVMEKKMHNSKEKEQIISFALGESLEQEITHLVGEEYSYTALPTINLYNSSNNHRQDSISGISSSSWANLTSDEKTLYKNSLANTQHILIENSDSKDFEENIQEDFAEIAKKNINNNILENTLIYLQDIKKVENKLTLTQTLLSIEKNILDAQKSQNKIIQEVLHIVTKEKDFYNSLHKFEALLGEVFPDIALHLLFFKDESLFIENTLFSNYHSKTIINHYKDKDAIQKKIHIIDILSENQKAIEQDIVFHSRDLRKDETILGYIGLSYKCERMFSKNESSLLELFCHELHEALLNKISTAQMEKLLLRDELTKNHNKKYFKETVQKKLQENIALSLIMLDIDHFKEINDKHGHLAGDFVLSKIGLILREYENEDIFAARFGSEEFSILLSKYSKEKTLEFAKKILDQIEKKPIEFKEKIINVTASIGISVKEDSENKTFADFVEEADNALYSAKEMGRNRVVIAE